jgi:hypothetical protein
MRAVAVTISLVLAAPPEPTVEPAVAPEPEPAVAPEPTLDCMLDDCEAGEPEPTPEAVGPTAEELKLEGRGLVAQGEYAEGIAKLEQAYQLAPGDHIIAYDIAMAAEKARDCQKMHMYLKHFVQYADRNEFPNKIDKASRTIDSSWCFTNTGDEISEVRATRSSRAPAQGNGDGLMAGGAIMLGLGLIAVGAGIGLAVVGVKETAAAAGTLEVPDPKYRGFVIGGAILGPSGVALAVGGIVMIVRGNQMANIALAPTGVTVRF